jgi:hypothetical protein
VALYMGWAKLLSLVSAGVEFASARTGVGVHPRKVLARRALGFAPVSAFRPAISNQLRTGTDQGNPTV